MPEERERGNRFSLKEVDREKAGEHTGLKLQPNKHKL